MSSKKVSPDGPEIPKYFSQGEIKQHPQIQPFEALDFSSHSSKHYNLSDLSIILIDAIKSKSIEKTIEIFKKFKDSNITIENLYEILDSNLNFDEKAHLDSFFYLFEKLESKFSSNSKELFLNKILNSDSKLLAEKFVKHFTKIVDPIHKKFIFEAASKFNLIDQLKSILTKTSLDPITDYNLIMNCIKLTAIFNSNQCFNFLIDKFHFIPKIFKHAFSYAALKQNILILNSIISNKYFIKDESRFELLNRAIKDGNIELTKIFLDKIPIEQHRYFEAIKYALEEKKSNILILLLDKYLPPSDLLIKCINLLIESGEADAINHILQKQPNVITNFEDVFKLSLEKECLPLLTTILKKNKIPFELTINYLPSILTKKNTLILENLINYSTNKSDLLKIIASNIEENLNFYIFDFLITKKLDDTVNKFKIIKSMIMIKYSDDELCINLIKKLQFSVTDLKNLIQISLLNNKSNIFDNLIIKKEFKEIDIEDLLKICISTNRPEYLLELIEAHPKKSINYALAFEAAIKNDNFLIAFKLFPKITPTDEQFYYLLNKSITTSEHKILSDLLDFAEKKSININSESIGNLLMQNKYPDFSILKIMIEKVNFSKNLKSLFLVNALTFNKPDLIFTILKDTEIKKIEFINALNYLFKTKNIEVLNSLILKFPLTNEEKIKIVESNDLDLIFFLSDSDKVSFDKSIWQTILKTSITNNYEKLIKISFDKSNLDSNELEKFLQLSTSVKNHFATNIILSKLKKPTNLILNTLLKNIEKKENIEFKQNFDKLIFNKENFDELIIKCVENSNVDLFEYLLLKKPEFFDLNSISKIIGFSSFISFVESLSTTLTKLKLNQTIIDKLIPFICQKQNFETLQKIISLNPECDFKPHLEKIFTASIKLENLDFIEKNFYLIANDPKLVTNIFKISVEYSFFKAIEFLASKLKKTSEDLNPTFLKLLNLKKIELFRDITTNDLLSTADMGSLLISAANSRNVDFIYKYLNNQKLPLNIAEKLFFIGLEKDESFILDTILTEYQIPDNSIKIALSKSISDKSLNIIYSKIKTKPESFKDDLIKNLIETKSFKSLEQLISKNFLNIPQLIKLFESTRILNSTRLSIYILEHVNKNNLEFKEFAPYLLNNLKDDYLLELIEKVKLDIDTINNIIKYAFDSDKPNIFEHCCTVYPELKNKFNQYIFLQILENKRISNSFFSILDFSYASKDQKNKLIEHLYNTSNTNKLEIFLSKDSYDEQILNNLLLDSLKSEKDKFANSLIDKFTYQDDTLKESIKICISRNNKYLFLKILEKTTFNNKDLEEIINIAITSKCEWAINEILKKPQIFNLTFNKNLLFYLIETKNWGIFEESIRRKKIPEEYLFDIFEKLAIDNSISDDEKKSLYLILFEVYPQEEKIKIKYAPIEFLVDAPAAIKINLDEHNYERVRVLLNETKISDSLFFYTASEFIKNHQESLLIDLLTPKLKSKDKNLLPLYNKIITECVKTKNNQSLYFLLENSPDKTASLNYLINDINLKPPLNQKEEFEFILPIISKIKEFQLLNAKQISIHLSPELIDKCINFAILKGNFEIIDLLISLSSNKELALETIIDNCFKTFNFSYIEKTLLEKNSKFLKKSKIEDTLKKLLTLNQPRQFINCLHLIQPLSRSFVTLIIEVTSKHISSSTNFKSENLELLQLIVNDKNLKRVVFDNQYFLKNVNNIFTSAIWHNKKELFNALLESKFVTDSNIDELISTCCTSNQQNFLKTLLKIKKPPVENLMELVNKTKSKILTQEILSSFKFSYKQLSQLYNISISNNDSFSVFLLLKKFKYPIADINSIKTLISKSNDLIKDAILEKKEEAALYFLKKFENSDFLNDIFISSIENSTYQVVNFILEKKQINNASYLKALEISLNKKNLKSIEILLNQKLISSKNYIKVCDVLAKFNHLDNIFKILKRFNPDKDNLEKFLKLGFENKNYTFITLLLKKFNLFNEAFLFCLEFKNANILLLLFKKLSRNQISLLNQTLIEEASGNRFDLLEAIIAKQKISNETANKLLPLAVKNNKIEIVRFILKNNRLNRLSIYSSLTNAEHKFKDIHNLLSIYEEKHRRSL